MNSCGRGNVYPVDTEIVLNALFVSVGSGGTPVDPSAIIVNLEDPTGAITTFTYPNQVSRTGVGAYSYTFVVTLPGQWVYSWEGTGQVVATSFDKEFFVKASAFY